MSSAAAAAVAGSGAQQVPTQSPIAHQSRIWTAWWVAVAPLLLVLGFWWREALVGFHPTDDGFVLAQSWRLLLGETIHVDFTSPRPLGSAFLHLPDVISPTYTLAISRLLVVLQLLWIASATVSLASWRRGVGPASRFFLIGIAFMLNIGTWPVMAWHTIDGVFLGITALWAVAMADGSSRPKPWWALAWLLAGAAPLIKQGFVVVPLLVAGLMLLSGQRRGLWWVPVALLPPLGYLAAARWQVRTVVDQVYAGQSSEALAPLEALVAVVASPDGWLTTGCALLGLVLALSVRPGQLGAVLRAIAVALVATPTLLIGHQEGFAMLTAPESADGAVVWPFVATWTLVVVSFAMLSVWPRWASLGALVGLGLAVSASWGVPNPGLFAGSLLVAALVTVVAPRRPTDSTAVHPGMGNSAFSYLPVVALAVVFIVTSVGVLAARADNVYRQGPRGGITESVDVPGLRGITMTAESAAFLDQIRRCQDQTLTTRGAVIPEGPAVYPLLRMQPVFDIDWWLPGEIPADIAARTAEDATRLNGQDDWLVLSTPEAAGTWSGLEGQPISCGSLVGVYRPGGQ